ncbi:MAG: hypothetical protein U0R76_07755 [Candidatus Nanopelagicales bacterium]
MEVRREMVEEEGHPLGDLAPVRAVVVVEDEVDVDRLRTDLVHEGRDELGGRRLPALEGCEEIGADIGDGLVQRGDDVGPERARLRVALLERHPGDHAVLRDGRRHPGGDGGRLAEAGRGRDERELRVAGDAEAGGEPSAVHKSSTRARDVELGGDQGTAHAAPPPDPRPV